jgi:cyclophilin family peptidyl-prolyl cis-trans isomerase
MPSRSRDRQLAKLAARRQAERDAARRRRHALVGGLGAGVLVLAIVGSLLALKNGEGASSSPTPTPTPTGSVSPSTPPTGPVKVTGYLQPTAPTQKTVACGAEAPSDATKKKPQFSHAPTPEQVLDAGATYTAVVQTSCGTITFSLDAKGAPNTVASFVFLARKGFFDGMRFHRVVDSIDVIQTGDPKGDGTGGPGYTIPDEVAANAHYAPGVVAMAKGQTPNSGGSQFFIITGPQGAGLDNNPAYTIFGEVQGGLDVAKQINSFMKGANYDGPPTKVVYVERVTIEEKK